MAWGGVINLSRATTAPRMAGYSESDRQFALGVLHDLHPSMCRRVAQARGLFLEDGRDACVGAWAPHLAALGGPGKALPELAGEMARLVWFSADVLGLHWRQRLALAMRGAERLALRSDEAVDWFWCRMAQNVRGGA